MTMNTQAQRATEGVNDALLAGFVNVAEDGTLCFVSDRLYRSCPACGTVFAGSAWRSALIGPQRCPYCGRGGTRPLGVAGVA